MDLNKHFSVTERIFYLFVHKNLSSRYSFNLFRIFEIIIFCFVVAICDLVHDVQTIFHLSYLLTASGNLF